MAVQLKDDATTVMNALKDLGEPIKLKDLVELTKDDVDWKAQKGWTGQILSFMKKTNYIKRAGFGLYEYGESLETKKRVKKSPIKKSPAKKVKPKPTVSDESMLEITDESKALLESFREATMPIVINNATPAPTKEQHKIGDIVEGKVSGVEEYGAFIENELMQGLIHITNISRGLVTDVHRHFKLGDIVKARVVSIKVGGKLALSTREFELPDYFKNQEIREKLEPAMAKVSRSGTVTVVKEDEHKEVFKFIQNITGIVSEQAKEKIRTMIENEGMFKFAMALNSVKSNFEIDVSMMLAKEIEEKMRDGL